jgi:hypothetical protein
MGIAIESPLYDRLFELVEKKVTRNAMLRALEARFGAVAVNLADEVRTVDDMSELEDLLRYSVTCPNLESFRLRLLPEPMIVPKYGSNVTPA